MRLKLLACSKKAWLALVFVCPIVWADQPLSLWQLESPAAKVFLMGSIHVMRDDMYPLAIEFEQAFDESTQAVFEIDILEASTAEAMQYMSAKATYSSGDSIHTRLAPDTIDLLRGYTQENNLRLEQFERLRPWMISLNLGMLELAKLGLDPNKGIDVYFQNKARSTGRAVLALESFTEQIDVLSDGPSHVQELSLVYALENLEASDDSINSLIAAWSNGNADAMYELAAEDYEQHPELQLQLKSLLDVRNIKMSRKISEYLATSEGLTDRAKKPVYFVAVGALHMGGPKGLLALLGDTYEIQQLSHSSK